MKLINLQSDHLSDVMADLLPSGMMFNSANKSGDSMHSCKFDQSSYISYLVDEAVKEAESFTGPSTTHSQPSGVPPYRENAPYPVDNISTLHTGVFGYPPTNNIGFHSTVAIPLDESSEYRAPVQQGLIENPLLLAGLPLACLELPSSIGAFSNSSSGHQSEISTYASLSRSQPNSFRLHQHIGLNEPQVINASQLNNTIQVQFQFGDNDPFAVQSKGPKESNDSNVNWQSENYDIGSSNIENFPTNSSNTNIHLISNLPELGDFSQFYVSNILGHDGNYLNNNTPNNNYTNVENNRFDHHSQARQYFNQFMQNEKNKCQKPIHINCSMKEKLKPNSSTPSQNSSTKTRPFDHEDRYIGTDSIKVPKNQVSILKQKANFHATSNDYFKDYLEIVSKQKTEKAKTAAAKFIASFTETSKCSQSNDVERMNLTYQCGDCSYCYDKLADLKKHIRHIHKKGNNSEIIEDLNDVVILNDQEAGGDVNVIDLTETEKLDDVAMVGERDERDNNISDDKYITESDQMEIEHNEPHSYLCTICGYDSNTIEESNVHKESHKDELDHERVGTEMHKGQQEYYKRTKEMVENQKMREEEDRKRKKEQAMCWAKCKIRESSYHKKIGYIPGPKSMKITPAENSVRSKLAQRSPTNYEPENLPRRIATTSAKNSLMNPSKGKQKRIRDTKNLNKENELLMKLFGIIPSKVCLSRVQQAENADIQNEKNECGNRNANQILEICENERDTDKRTEKAAAQIEVDKNIISSNSNKEIEGKECVLENVAFSDDDSDIELLEPPKVLIVLDDDDDDTDNGLLKKNPKKSDREMMKEYGVNDVTIKLDKTEKIDKTPTKQPRSKSDKELLEHFGIKNPSVSLNNSPVKPKAVPKPGPKSSKTQNIKRKMKEVKSTSEITSPVANFDEITPEQIDKMLKECGIGISVPTRMELNVSAEESKSERDRSPSPVPSTSKGHGHLKRKRTARKSTQDSALFKKYKLKDSKVILKGLSRIDVSLLRNPNSSFGKRDWLKHKFDSDTESDNDFDIPTPPLTEEFIDSTSVDSNLSRRNVNDGQNTKNGSISGKAGRTSPVKQTDLQVMEKFGIVDAVVVIDNPKKKPAHSLSSCMRTCSSDAALLKKFGIPHTMVAIKTTDKSPHKKTCETKPQISTPGCISFSDFQTALDSARKNILGKLKGSTKGSSQYREKHNSETKKGTESENSSPRKLRRKLEVITCEPNTKIVKMPATNNSLKRLRSRSVNHDQKSLKIDDDRHSIKYAKRFGSISGKIARNVLPSKQKGLSGKLQLNKLNTSFKAYKAKAVSKARVANNTRNRNERDTHDCGMLKGNIDDIAEIQFIEKKHVVKTARYRRALTSNDESEENTKSKFEQLAKGFSKVKVSVPCLTDIEIMKFSRKVSTIDNNSKCSEFDHSEEIAHTIINTLLDQVCGVEELAVEKAEDIESDISLISEVSENKEDARNNISQNSNSNDSNEENMCMGRKDLNVVQENDKNNEKHRNEDIDNIPLAKSKFYDGNDLFDEGEGDIDDENDKTDKKINYGSKESLVLKLKEREALMKVSDYIEEECGSTDDTNVDGNENKQCDNANEVYVNDKDNANVDGTEHEQCHYTKEIPVNDTESTELNEVTQVDSDSKEETSTWKNGGIEVQLVLKRSATHLIIDKDSGSMIGDVYSVNESPKTANKGNERELEKEQGIEADILKHISSNYKHSRVTTPDDIIETITEHE